MICRFVRRGSGHRVRVRAGARPRGQRGFPRDGSADPDDHAGVDIPLWMVALSTAFAVVFGKEVFGGTGMNVFNPALLARAFAFFAYTPFDVGRDGVVLRLDDDLRRAHGRRHHRRYGPRTASSTTGADGLLGRWMPSSASSPDAFAETSTLAILLGARDPPVHGRRFVAHDGRRCSSADWRWAISSRRSA